jgi:hypothetical protein
MYMANILRKQKRVWWLDVGSMLIVAFCFVCATLLVSANWTALDVSVRVFLILQLSANGAVFVLIAPSVVLRRGLAHYLHLLYMAAGEQLVVLTLLALSLVIRSDTSTRSFVSVFVVFAALANAARNVYKASFLLVDKRNVAARSLLFWSAYLLLLMGTNLVYTAVEMSRSVLTVNYAGTLVGATGGTYVTIVVAAVIGTYITDAYRNAEMIEAKTGKEPDEPVNVGYN